MPSSAVQTDTPRSSSVEQYRHGIGRKLVFLAVLVGLVVLSVGVSASLGASSLSVGDAFLAMWDRFVPVEGLTRFARVVVWQLRLPRIFLGLVVGLSLGVSGAAMQGILRNPLVSPYTLGISSGAAFGAALAIVMGVGILGVGQYVIVANAFVFALLTMLLVYGVSRLGGTALETLILAGVAIGYLFQALISALRYLSDNEQLRELTFWIMGGLYAATFNVVLMLVPIVTVLSLVVMKFAWDLNVMSAGEDVASSLGINVKTLRLVVLTIASILTAAVIAFTGIIGFIGLVAPHICRLILGNDHRFLIPGSGIMGALILVVADTAARLVAAPMEIPVGIMTSFIGIPFFLYLLITRRRKWWH
jgi:iron complex transport system permease protein